MDFLRNIAEGKSTTEALHLVDRSPNTLRYWERSDKRFCEQYKTHMAARKTANGKERLPFREFRRKYLRSETFAHQQNMIDAIEGRTPTWLHPAMKFEKRDPQHVLINVPPDHAKSMTLTIDWVTYCLMMDPNERIVICSKTAELARQFLWAIKQRLTNDSYADLIRDFAPADGFDGEDAIWQSNMIYFPSSIRDPEQKDPTVQCVGIGGRLYGQRTTKLIVDDAVLLSNAHQYENQIRWLQQEVVTRIGDTGQLIVVGTRVDVVDMYRELRNEDRYDGTGSPWTYLGMPAVLEFADKPEDWVTLWPRSDRPWVSSGASPDEHGLYPRWDGVRLHRRRSLLDPKTWAMVYQQADVASTSIFDPRMVRECVNGNRTVGQLVTGNKYHRGGLGMEGMYIVCGMDPAMVGDTATIAYGVDMRTLKRYVLDAHRMRAPSPAAIQELIFTWTEKYRPQCWIIEKNAFQLYLTRDERIRGFLASRGIAMREHYTSGRGKIDPDFGVASVSPLFNEHMIELPSSHNCEGAKALVEQLITWQPGVKGKDLVQDLPMALWFCELAAREAIDQRSMRASSHGANKYIPRYRRGQQNVVNLDEVLREREYRIA